MKQALFLTGAAARISQEVAIIDQLMAQKGLSITPEDTFLAGFSSGALNMTALNACFRKEKPLSWDQHYKKEILFRLTSEQVYQKRQSFPFDTGRCEKQLKNLCSKPVLTVSPTCRFATTSWPFRSGVCRSFGPVTTPPNMGIPGYPIC